MPPNRTTTWAMPGKIKGGSMRRLQATAGRWQRSPITSKPITTWAMPFGTRGRLDEAIANYCRALELRPDYAEACNNLATL